MTTIKNRSELLFLYDVKYANPNGDPLNANRPRMDEETRHCLVTDVRLKRTVRDFLFENGFNGTSDLGDIFIREVDGKPVTGQKRSEAYKDKDDFLEKFIDGRLFGAVSAPKGKDKNKVFHLTGPVQFGIGKSLHPVRENFIKGTGAFTTKEKAEQRTFREEYNITYGIIGFHGVINENAAIETQLKEDDVNWLLRGMWKGTKNLLTRSKKGHMPRLLIKIDYQDGFFIGDLLKRIKLNSNGKDPELFEDINDFNVDVSELNKALEKHVDKILNVAVLKDERISLTEDIYNESKLIL